LSVHTYVHTVCLYVCTYGRTFETGFIESTLSKSQPKKWTLMPSVNVDGFATSTACCDLDL